MIRIAVDELVVVLFAIVVLTVLVTMAVAKVGAILAESKKRKETKRNSFRLPKRTCKPYQGEGDPNAQ